MTKLPTEMIAEILSFLPPKSLCRFQSVAKSWHFLITSDAFIKLHLSKTLNFQPPNLFICRDSLSSAAKPNGFLSSAAVNPNEFSFSAVDHPVKHPNVEVIGSCRGILCIADELKKTVFYFNPSTKTRRLIPPGPTEIPSSDDPELTHINPYILKLIDHVVAFGFGYDSSVDDYKLLRIIDCYVARVRICGEVMLYSMRSNSWKQVKDDFDDYGILGMDAVHVNGVLYFPVYQVIQVNRVTCVKCFDLKTEKFSVFGGFEYDKSFDKFHLVWVELGGCYAGMANCLIEDPSMQFGCRLACAELWVRKEVSWVRLFRVSCPFKIGSLSLIKPVVYSDDGGRVLLQLDGSKFSWFDWRSNEFTEVKACGIPSMYSPFVTYTFVPSIVSLRSDDDKANDERKDKGKVVSKKNVNKRNMDDFLSAGSS